MVYFRSGSAPQCNVYMNYSFWEPHFSLKAKDAGQLTAGQREFISGFNAEFDRRVAPRLAQPCAVPRDWMLLSDERKRQLYEVCRAAETSLGIAEDGWGRSRLPAPSNCISPRLDSAGAVTLTAARQTASMAIAAWMQSSLTGR